MEDIGSRKFGEFLHFNDLVDLSFLGPRFTCHNNRLGGARAWRRIDHVFVMASWI